MSSKGLEVATRHADMSSYFDAMMICKTPDITRAAIITDAAGLIDDA